MAAQAWFSSGDVEVAPGTTAVLQLTVVNLADTTDSFAITPVGMTAAWTTLRPATLTLFGGTQQVIDVEVSPPVLSSTIAGPTALSVRIVPQRDPDNLTTAETTLVIGESYDRRLHVLQPALRGRRSATYDMMLENRGNTLATCRLHLVDPSGRLDGEFDPPAAGVEPGASTLVRLKLHATSPQWQSNARTIPFRIEADQPGSPTASAPATFVQTPVVSGALGPKGAAAAAIVLAIVLGWFGIVKPAIRDAARDAVRTIAPSGVVGVNSTVPTQGSDPVDSTPSNNNATKGDTAGIPLPSSVAQGQSGKNEYTVPAGKRLRITDIVIQNPNADQGTLTLSANGNALFTYNLSQMFADVDQPLVTPIELLAGQKFGVEVKCDGFGDLTANACKPNVFISGLLVDA
jgi:hypothetical protein